MSNDQIEAILSMTRDMEVIESVVKNTGRFVGNMVHISIADLAAALLQHQQDGGWRPIETCPKIHGVDYRLWDADDNEERITWYGNGEWCFEGNYTHWMPLPPAPKKENDDA